MNLITIPDADDRGLANECVRQREVEREQNENAEWREKQQKQQKNWCLNT